MLKLTRGECPKELDDQTVDELTKLYKQDKEKDVWNSPRIRGPLKKH